MTTRTRLRLLLRETEARLVHVMEVHQNRLDEWNAKEANYKMQLGIARLALLRIAKDLRPKADEV